VDTHVVLRKLAIAYYRRLGNADRAAEADETANGHEAEDRAPFPGPAQPHFGVPPEEATAPEAGGAA
jgi:hypothetical protein